MLNRIYIETSIPSFYFTERSSAEAIARKNWTRQWWQEYSSQFTLLTSSAVISELRQGKSPATEDRINLLKELELLEITTEIEEITTVYIDKLVMPNDPAGDALHLALASFHKADVLLTWNCRHLANPNKFNHIRVINYQLGLPTPVLTTPMNYFGGESDD
ncbi:MAG: hypothetical protein DRR19_01825 [Candidatus Parabeggiatoa sp. nov. 1]|nr:MAG: hypothetical protein DRR19_01825 [Gammaproteobacteria bacterium]